MVNNDTYDFGQFPFVYAPLIRPTNESFPDFLPFQIEIDNETGLIIQSHNQDVVNALHEAYIASSQITGMMDSHGIGKEYADDFLAYIKRQTGRSNFVGIRVLDIGCGTGYLLHLLKNLGAEVVGIEPGVHGQEGSETYNVPIVHDFFPSTQITGNFDIIVSFGLLEHIENFDNFFKHIVSCLRTNGTIIFGVPDCEPYLYSGDISFLFHEHWNYLTKNELMSTIVKYTGLHTEIHSSGFGGTIYSTTSSRMRTSGVSVDIDIQRKRLHEFHTKSGYVSDRIIKLFQEAEINNKSIGVFVPCRIVNILASVSQQINLNNVRFFDDNIKLHGTYYPGIDIKIESRDDLLQNPTDKLLIMSHSFCRKIYQELKNQRLNSKIITWEDIFSF